MTVAASKIVMSASAPTRIRPLSAIVGTVVYDETRLTTVNPKIEGWVEHLYVDFTGAPIREGEPLMDVYSPALVSAQEELVLAVRLVREAKSGRPLTNAEELLTSARRRLAAGHGPLLEGHPPRYRVALQGRAALYRASASLRDALSAVGFRTPSLAARPT